MAVDVDDASESLQMLQEIEGLLQLPDVPEHTLKARRLALSRHGERRAAKWRTWQ